MQRTARFRCGNASPSLPASSVVTKYGKPGSTNGPNFGSWLLALPSRVSVATAPSARAAPQRAPLSVRRTAFVTAPSPTHDGHRLRRAPRLPPLPVLARQALVRVGDVRDLHVRAVVEDLLPWPARSATMPSSIVSVSGAAYSNGELAVPSPLHAFAQLTSCDVVDARHGLRHGCGAAAPALPDRPSACRRTSRRELPLSPMNTPPPPSPRGARIVGRRAIARHQSTVVPVELHRRLRPRAGNS